MKYLIKVFQFIYCLYAFMVFLVLMFILFPFVILVSLFREPYSGNLVYHICIFWAKTAMLFWGIRHRNIYEFPHDVKRPVVFIFNHISFMDIPILLKSFSKQHFRVLGKAEMAKIPIFGFIYKAAVVLVERSDAGKRAESVRKLKEVLKDDISIVIAPEGTFNMTEKPLKEFFDGAFKIAVETQTPIKPVLFLDAYDRLNYHSIFSLTPGISRAIFLEEIDTKGYDLETVKDLKQKVYDIMQAGLIRYKASWINVQNLT